MNISKLKSISLAAGLIWAWTGSTNAQVIYQTTFTGKSATTISGTAPDVASGQAGGSSPATWNLTTTNLTAQLANGNASATPCSSLLPFTPQPGYLYRVIASVTLSANSGNWMGLGFSPTDPSGSGGRLNDLASPCWELARTTSGGNEQTFGTGGTGTLLNANVINAAGTYPLEIDLDTRGTNWIATYFMAGAQQAGAYTFTNTPTITAVGLTDNGVTGGNLWNSFEVDATVSLPLITVQPAGQTVTAGYSTQLSVQAWGGPATAGYYWQAGVSGSGVFTNTVDGSGVTGSATPTLTINPVVAGPVDYRVIVTNVNGAVTSSVVTVNGQNIAPTLTTDIHPNPFTAPAGYTFTLSAGVNTNASLPLSYVWELNGNALTNGGRISGAATAALTIASGQVTDSGTYQLIVSNGAGSVSTSPDVVNIEPGFGLYDGTAWTTNGTATFIASNDLQLTSDAYQAQAGSAYFDYPVQITNFGVTFTATADLIGGDGGFAFVLQNKGATALGGTGPNLGVSGVGSSVELEFNCAVAPATMALAVNGAIGPFGPTGAVDAQGTAPMTVTVFYSGNVLGVTLQQNGNTFATNYTVNIPSTVGANTAYLGFSGGIAYYGTQHTISDLSYSTLSGAPVVVGDVPLTLSRPQGAMLRIQPTIAGSLPLSFQWTHNSQPITGATNEMLVITHTQASDAGNYQLLATNSAGSTNTSVCDVSFYSPVTLEPDGQVVYYNDFNVKQYWTGTAFTNGGTIDGTAPDIATNFAGGSASALWYNANNSNGLAANGTIITLEQNSTLLPLAIQPGYFYKMTANISMPANSGNWVGIGFCTNRPIDSQSAASRMTDLGGGPWMLASTVANEQCFGGPATANKVAALNFFPDGTATNITLEIDLDTTAGAWAATWLINGTEITNFVYATNPTRLVAAGLTMNAAINFTVNNFELQAAQRVVPNGITLSNNLVVVRDVNNNPTGIVLSGSGSGSGTGVAGWGFHLLSTTNVALPLNQWQSVAATLNANSQFSITNPIAPGTNQMFFKVTMP